MRYWLMSARIHGTEIQPIWAGKTYVYDMVYPNDRLKIGDIVYLSFHGLYSWGYVAKKERYQDNVVAREMLRVSVVRPVVRQGLVSKEQIEQESELAQLFTYQETNLIELTAIQIRKFNQLLSLQTNEIPPDPDDIDLPRESSDMGTAKVEFTFIINRPIKLEETRHTEFKQVKGNNPVNAIKNTADEYAVAFHNVNGGRILWGVCNEDALVVGVKLNFTQKDEIRREVVNKIGKIQPPVPLSDFRLEFHSVLDEQGQSIADLYVVDLVAPRGEPTELYATGSGDVFVKTDGGKKILNHIEKTAEIRRRSKS